MQKLAKTAEEKKKITTIHIEESTYRAFKKFSVDKDRSITSLVKGAMLDMLDGKYYPTE